MVMADGDFGWTAGTLRRMTVRADHELVLDERRRTSLAKVGRKEDRRYIVEELDDGTLVLTPAVTISRAELAALANPAVRAALDAATHGDRRQLRRRPAFTEHANE